MTLQKLSNCFRQHEIIFGFGVKQNATYFSIDTIECMQIFSCASSAFNPFTENMLVKNSVRSITRNKLKVV